MGATPNLVILHSSRFDKLKALSPSKGFVIPSRAPRILIAP
jgi:hypothetical protein